MIKAFEVVRMIAGDVPVCEAPEDVLDSLSYFPVPPFLAGVVAPRIQCIFLTNPCSTDGRSLAIAAHEAFHALRLMQGHPFYRAPMGIHHPVEEVQEEMAVNALTGNFLADLLKDDPERLREAFALVYESEVSYVDGMYLTFERIRREQRQRERLQAAVTEVYGAVIRYTDQVRRLTGQRDMVCEFIKMFAGDTDGDFEGGYCD